MWFKKFFEDEFGKPSALRLYSLVALVIAGVLSFQNPINYGLALTWLVAAFAPKSIQGLASTWTLPKGGKK